MKYWCLFLFFTCSLFAEEGRQKSEVNPSREKEIRINVLACREREIGYVYGLEIIREAFAAAGDSVYFETTGEGDYLFPVALNNPKYYKTEPFVSLDSYFIAADTTDLRFPEKGDITIGVYGTPGYLSYLGNTYSLKRYKTPADLLKAWQKKEVAAILLDYAPQVPPQNLYLPMPSNGFAEEGYCLGAVHAENRLIEFQSGLKKLMENGRLKELTLKFYGED